MVAETRFILGLPLGEHPVSSKLGRYFAATSYIEFSIIMCMAAALGDGADLDKGQKALKKDWRISGKIRKLEAAAKKSRALDDYRRNIVEKAGAFLREANARRNTYAHCIFEHSSDGQVRMHPFGIGGGEQNTPQLLEPERIEGDILVLETAFRMGQFVSGRISRDRLQPYLDRLLNAKHDVNP